MQAALPGLPGRRHSRRRKRRRLRCPPASPTPPRARAPRSLCCASNDLMPPAYPAWLHAGCAGVHNVSIYLSGWKDGWLGRPDARAPPPPPPPCPAVRVMAGSRGGVAGPIKLRNPGMLLDVRLQPGASFTQVGAAPGCPAVWQRGCSPACHAWPDWLACLLQTGCLPPMRCECMHLLPAAPWALGSMVTSRSRWPRFLAFYCSAQCHTRSLLQHVPEAWNGFAYVYEGKGRIGDKNAQARGECMRGQAGCSSKPRAGHWLLHDMRVWPPLPPQVALAQLLLLPMRAGRLLLTCAPSRPPFFPPCRRSMPTSFTTRGTR